MLMRGLLGLKNIRIGPMRIGSKSFGRTSVLWKEEVEKEENGFSVLRLRNGIKT